MHTHTHTRTHAHTEGQKREIANLKKTWPPSFVLMVGLCWLRKNAHIQCNPVYETFHRLCFYRNELIVWQSSKRDLGVANLRPVLGHGCGKKTQSARISVRICYMFLILKCRRDSDLGLCITCKKNAVAQWRLLTNFVAKHDFESQVATAQWHSLCKS